MIKILIPIIILIIILIIGTANGITVGVSTKNDYGISFSDSITMNGDIGASGGYLLGGNGVSSDFTAQIGAGSFGEDTKVQMSSGVPHCLHMDISKSIDNKGEGLAYSSTKNCIDGQFVNVESYLQTNSNIDHGEMHSDIGNKITMQDNADAIWHYQNVQAESDLTYNGNGITEVPMKIEASPLP